jgi:hypothetical protein
MKYFQKVNDVQGTLHVDAYLTDWSEGYIQDASMFISPVAATNIPVIHQSNKYVKYPRGYFWRDQMEVRPLGGRPAQVDYKVESGTYFAEEWALEHTIDDRQRANVDAPINLEQNAVNLLTQQQLIRADRLWVQNFFAPSIWTNTEEGGTDFTPFDATGSDPVGVVDEYATLMMQTTAMKPNVLVLGVNVYNALRVNASILDRIKYTQRGVVTLDLLAALFDIERVVVARSVYNAAAEGVADDFEFIADADSMLMLYIAPVPALNAPTAISRFAWTNLIPGSMNQYGGVITRGRDERAYTDYFHNRAAFGFELVSQDLGIFFQYAANAPT